MTLTPSSKQDTESSRGGTAVQPPVEALLGEMLSLRSRLQGAVDQLHCNRVRVYLPNSSALIYGRRALSETLTLTEDLAALVASEEAEHLRPPSFASLFEHSEGTSTSPATVEKDTEEEVIEESLDRLIAQFTASNERNSELLKKHRDTFHRAGVAEINRWAVTTAVQAPPVEEAGATTGHSTGMPLSSAAQWAMNQERQLELESQIQELTKSVAHSERRAVEKRRGVEALLVDVNTVEAAISQLHQDQDARISEIEQMRLDALAELGRSYRLKVDPLKTVLAEREVVLEVEEKQLAQLNEDLERQYQAQASASGLEKLLEEVALVEKKLKDSGVESL